MQPAVKAEAAVAGRGE